MVGSTKFCEWFTVWWVYPSEGIRQYARHSSDMIRVPGLMYVCIMGSSVAADLSGTTLGFEHLKDKQVAAMTSFLKGNDTFVSLPTGYGKSIIYAALGSY